MNTLAYTNHATEQNKLKDRVDRVYGSLRAHIIPKKEFLPQAWKTIAVFCDEHRDNSLLKATFARYPDFMARGFALITAQQGLFTYEPDNPHILKALINLLGEDLAKQRSLIYEQVIKGSVCGYFPELAKMLEIIESIYGMEDAELSLLPDTPYLGYQQLTLGCPWLICEEPTSPAIREALISLNGKSYVPIMGIEFAC